MELFSIRIQRTFQLVSTQLCVTLHAKYISYGEIHRFVEQIHFLPPSLFPNGFLVDSHFIPPLIRLYTKDSCTFNEATTTECTSRSQALNRYISL